MSTILSDGQPNAHIDLYLFTDTCMYSFAASWFVPVKITTTTNQGTTVSMRDSYLVGAFDSGMLPMAPGAPTLSGSTQSTLDSELSTALNFISQTNHTIEPGSVSWSFRRVAAPPP